MKYVVIEVPYGAVLAIPAGAESLHGAMIVDRRSYDWNDLTASNKQIECRFVNPEDIKPYVEPTPVPQTVAVDVAVDPPTEIVPDIPF